jgi:hypothetical protein
MWRQESVHSSRSTGASASVVRFSRATARYVVLVAVLGTEDRLEAPLQLRRLEDPIQPFRIPSGTASSRYVAAFRQGS